MELFKTFVSFSKHNVLASSISEFYVFLSKCSCGLCCALSSVKFVVSHFLFINSFAVLFRNDHRMALIQMNSTEEAVAGLIVSVPTGIM